MSKYIPGNQKHLTLEDRLYIQEQLSNGTTFKDIARFLCKDPSTISKEVRAYRLSEFRRMGIFNNEKNFCLKRYLNFSGSEKEIGMMLRGDAGSLLV